MPPAPAPNAPLFSRFLWGENATPPALRHFEPSVRAAIEARLRARLGYKPTLTVPDGSNEEQRVPRRQQRFEAMLATLSGQPDLVKEAAAAARDIRLAYEYEGHLDPPMGEAVSAEAYLAAHPGTPLASALDLFILHRWRCAFEAATWDKNPPAQVRASASYRAAWDRLNRVDDVVVKAIARDIDESPYVYTGPELHPRAFKVR